MQRLHHRLYGKKKKRQLVSQTPRNLANTALYVAYRAWGGSQRSAPLKLSVKGAVRLGFPSFPSAIKSLRIGAAHPVLMMAHDAAHGPL